jgi:bifunctional non-homologous end joining protein LigD
VARPRLANTKKRDRKKTPEPFGGKKRGKTDLVVQRHDARRLHYDFRLERAGALASWAVPKGIPLRRGERHLAVHVEDHPLDYADFEGTIPAGQYGAGTVEIWDRGTYELVEEKRDGGLTVRLYGERLDGTWTLVPAKLDGDPKNWLLLRKDGADTRSARYSPMLATSSEDLPRGEGWAYEPKWDGFRAIVTVSGGEISLTSRNGNDLTDRFRELARAAAHGILAPDAVLDGEICALDEQGRSQFSLLQEAPDPALVSSTCSSSTRASSTSRSGAPEAPRARRRGAGPRLTAVRRRRALSPRPAQELEGRREARLPTARDAGSIGQGEVRQTQRS